MWWSSGERHRERHRDGQASDTTVVIRNWSSCYLHVLDGTMQSVGFFQVANDRHLDNYCRSALNEIVATVSLSTMPRLSWQSCCLWVGKRRHEGGRAVSGTRLAVRSRGMKWRHISTCVQNLATHFSHSGAMIGGVQIENGSCHPDHTPFRVFVHKLGPDIVYLYARCDD